MRGITLWFASGWLLLSACSGGEQALARAAKAPREVALHLVGTADLPRVVGVTGTLAAQEELVLGLQVGGRLQQLPVDLGDRVEAGALLAALDPRDFELELQRATAALATAYAKLGRADSGDRGSGDRGSGDLGSRDLGQVDLETLAPVKEAQAVLQEAQLQRERVVTMVQEQLSPPAELDSADAALAVAQSRLQRARDEARTQVAEVLQRRIELQQAEKRLADASLRAPWPGRVAARHASAGQVLAAGAPVLTLLRTDPLRLRLPVPERLASAVAVGQRVDFTVDGDAGRQPGGEAQQGLGAQHGTVVRLGANVDRGNGTVMVEAAVENAGGVLLPGGFCRASIVVAKAEPVLVVPKSAVVAFAGVERVFTVEQGKDGAQKAKGLIVDLGRSAGDQVEVLRGLASGTRIVRDAAGLTPEQAVKVVD